MNEVSLPQFEGQRVRVTPDGKFAAVDVLKAIGQKNPRAAWTALKSQYPEFAQETCTYSFGAGRPPEVLTEKGLLKLLMVAKGPKSALFREWAAVQIQRISSGDITLAAEILEKQTDPAKVEWLARRAENKGAALALNAGIKRHGGSQRVYSKVHDTLNVAVTGMTAREIQQRGQRTTKDNLSVPELTLSTMSQLATASGLEQRGAQGDGQILAVAGEVGQDISAFRRKWLGKRSYPADGLLKVDL